MVSGRYPRSRNSSTDTAPCRFDSFFLSGPRIIGRCAYDGQAASRASYSASWRGVEDSRSSPRMIVLTSMAMSSTGLANW